MRTFLAIVSAALISATALGSSVVLTDDVYVSSRQPNKNFNEGKDPGLEVNADASSFVRFDFSSLPTGTSGDLVVSATLIVFVQDLDTPGVFDVLRVQGPWTEETLTGSTAPPAVPAITGVAAAAASKFIAIDVTAAVRDWLGGQPNFGFAIRPSAGSGLEMLLDSKESTGTSHEPRIDVLLCGSGSTFYRDADDDGYGNASATTVACSAPAGYVTRAGDCDDSDAGVNPDATETCNGDDDDCDGASDEGIGSTFYRDADGDSFGTTANAVQACSAPPGYVSRSGDCNDANAAINPAATEVCNSADDDCDGLIDESGGGSTFYRDADGDGFGSMSNSVSACSPPPGYVANSGDCNDANAAIRPGATELCNGIDDDCDGVADDGAAASCPARPNTTAPVCTGGGCSYVCAPGFADCDGNPLNGCEVNLNDNPSCTGAEFLGSFPGDEGSASVIRTGNGEAFFRVQAREENPFSCKDTSVRFELFVPPGQNYDLIVRCESCSGPLVTSTNGPGGTERIFVFKEESCAFGVGDGSDQTFSAIVEVRLIDGDSCAPWTLRTFFNQPPSSPMIRCGS